MWLIEINKILTLWWWVVLSLSTILLSKVEMKLYFLAALAGADGLGKFLESWIVEVEKLNDKLNNNNKSNLKILTGDGINIDLLKTPKYFRIIKDPCSLGKNKTMFAV